MSSDDKAFNVPSAQKLEELLKNAQKRFSKEVKWKETLEQKYTRITEETIYEILSNNKVEHPYLILKCLAISSTKKIEKMHRDSAKSQCEEGENNYGLDWATDEGKLELAWQILTSVGLGEKDWMRLNPH